LKPNELFPIIAPDLAELDRVIAARLDSPVVLIQTITAYIIGAGGKRLRPVLLLLFARALGYGDTEAQRQQGHPAGRSGRVHPHRHAAARRRRRRVRPAPRPSRPPMPMFGNAASVLVGDFLYSRAFQMMVEVDDMRVMRCWPTPPT
jgi:octaprenyl-diphosphate synthase